MSFQLPLAILLALAATIGASAQVPADKTKPAKELFAAAAKPADLKARSYGRYARGCLAGGAALPIDGEAWQVMRLSRNRNWGHPMLVDFLERFAEKAQDEGWPGLLVGDMAQPRGGPMLGGHASHQGGLDADIWLQPMPDRTLSREEREKLGAKSVLIEDKREVDPEMFTAAHVKLLRRAALFPEVARIFVHPGIKKALCEAAGENRGWLRKIRPWWGHTEHFHVRLSCPANDPVCKNQAAPPPGDGCGKELAYWLSDAPWTPKKPEKPRKPKPPVTLADLPKQCTKVLTAESK